MNQAFAPIQPSLTNPIGALLQAARKQSGMTLEDIAQRTFIKQHYLQALENEHFESLPAPVYTSGYIRQVARLLGLDDAPLIQQYQYRQHQKNQSTEPAKPLFAPILTQRNGRPYVEQLSFTAPVVDTVVEAARSIDLEPLPSHENLQSGETVPMESTLLPTIAPHAPKQVVETIEGARKEALSMLYQTEQFADQVLSQLEQEIQKTLSTIRNGRSFLEQRLNSY